MQAPFEQRGNSPQHGQPPRERWVAAGILTSGSLAMLAVAPPMDLFTRLGPVGAGVTLVLLILSLGVHEAAHAWIAAICGDTTAKEMGRLTLDPRPHIDPVMTLLLPAMLMASGSGILFGGAKPVPVVFSRLRHPLRDMMFVALAGPLSNVLLAVFFAGLRGLVMTYTSQDDPAMLTPQVLKWAVLFNLVLAIFNMIPVPPLDGSRVMTWLLPESMRSGYASLERFGLLIVIVLIMTPVFGIVLRSTVPGAWDFVNAITFNGAGRLP